MNAVVFLDLRERSLSMCHGGGGGAGGGGGGGGYLGGV